MDTYDDTHVEYNWPGTYDILAFFCWHSCYLQLFTARDQSHRMEVCAYVFVVVTIKYSNTLTHHLMKMKKRHAL